MMEGRSEPLRVGLILDRPVAPRWIHRAVQALSDSTDARIALVIEVPDGGGRAARARDPVRSWRHIAYDAFQWLDARLFRGQPDPFETVDLSPLLRECPRLTVHVAPTRDGRCLNDADRDAIRHHRLDVALDFGSPPPRLGREPIARLGTWIYRHGSTPYLAARPAAFREVVGGRESLFTALVSDGSDGRPSRTLYKSWSATDRRSVRRTLNGCLPKLSEFPARVLRDVRAREHEGAPSDAAETSTAPPADYRPGTPGNLEVCHAAAILTSRYARDRLRWLALRETWHLAYAIGREGLAPRPERRLAPGPGFFWADPFPVADEEGWWIFFEEAPIATQVGHISVMRMDRAGRCQPPTTVMESTSHLSYPCVFRDGSRWYMVPESSATRSVSLFRARRFPFEWEQEEVLLRDVRAHDPTLAAIDGRWWMFTTLALDGGSSWDELHLFHADRPQGPWTAHPRNPVVSDARSARPAGHLFAHHGALYRPGQNCSLGYGRSITIQRIVRIDALEYSEIEEARVLPDWDRRAVGVHTLNRAADLTMMDCIYLATRGRSSG